MNLRKIFVFLLAPCVCFAGIRLQDLICIVEPHPYEGTKQLYYSIANFYNSLDKSQENQFLAAYFLAKAEKGGFGSGFIYVDRNGNNYIITNRHVVDQCEEADVKFENEDGTFKLFTDCKVLWVDPDVDLAVLAFPNNNKIFKIGFAI